MYVLTPHQCEYQLKRVKIIVFHIGTPRQLVNSVQADNQTCPSQIHLCSITTILTTWVDSFAFRRMMSSMFHCTKSTVQPTDGKQISHMMFSDLMLCKIWGF